MVLPYIDMSPPQVYTWSPSWTPLPLPPQTIPLGHPSVPAPSIQYHASNLDWQFVSHVIIYMFQCHSPRSSHPHPLPQSTKDCSIHLCLFCCLAYRVIVTIFLNSIYMCSVQFSCSVMSDSLRPHELQHARPPCPSPTPGVHSCSRPLSQWCYPAISSSAVPFSSCPQSLPASESFPMSQLFAWGGQSTGASALASFLPKKSQGWTPSEWTGWISCSPRDSQESSQTPQVKSINSSALSLLHSPTLTSIHDHRKNHSLD